MLHLCSQTFGRKERICPLDELAGLPGRNDCSVCYPSEKYFSLAGFAISLFCVFDIFFYSISWGLASFWLGNSHGLTFAIFLVTILLLDPPALDLFLTGPNDHRLAPFSLLHMFRFPLFLTSFSTRMVCAHGRIFVDFRVYAFFKVVVDSRIKAI